MKELHSVLFALASVVETDEKFYVRSDLNWLLFDVYFRDLNLASCGYSTKADKTNMNPAESSAATGTVTSQAYTIDLKSFQSTAFSLTPVIGSSFALEYPTKTTDPTLQWVVEMGRPILLAKRTVIAAPISIVKPLKW